MDRRPSRPTDIQSRYQDDALTQRPVHLCPGRPAAPRAWLLGRCRAISRDGKPAMRRGQFRPRRGPCCGSSPSWTRRLTAGRAGPVRRPSQPNRPNPRTPGRDPGFLHPHHAGLARRPADRPRGSLRRHRRHVERRDVPAPDLEPLAQRYVTVHLAESTFKGLSGILEDWIIGLSRLWLAAFPAQLGAAYAEAVERGRSQRREEIQVPVRRPDAAERDAILGGVPADRRELAYRRPDQWFRFLDNRVNSDARMRAPRRPCAR